jgi:hypothetical protein
MDEFSVHAQSFLSDVMNPAIGNAGTSVDGISFNAFVYYRRNWESNGPSLIGKAQAARTILNQFGLKKPIFIAEAGAEQGPVRNGLTEEQNANLVAQTATWAYVDSARATGDGIFALAWFTLSDTVDPAWAPNDWGLIRADGSKKAGFDAYSFVSRRLHGLRYIRSDSQPTFLSSGSPATPGSFCPADSWAPNATGMVCNSLQIYVFFDDVTSQEIWVMWIDPNRMRNTTNTTHVFIVPNGLTAAHDKYGAPFSVQNSTLFVSESPVFLTFQR